MRLGNKTICPIRQRALKHYPSVPRKVLPHAGAAQPAFTVHNQTTAQENLFGEADDLPMLEEIVISAVMGMSNTIGQSAVSIPNDNIGIRTGQERAFTGVETKDFGRIGADQGNELVGSNAPGAHSISPEDWQTVTYAR